MTRIILLLLVTLAGPFCTFTQASTLGSPTAIISTQEPLPSNTSAVTEAHEPKSTPEPEKTPEPASQDAITTSSSLPEAKTATEDNSTLNTTDSPVIHTDVETTAQTDAKKSTTEAAPEEPDNITIIEPNVENNTFGRTNTEPGEEVPASGTGQLVGIIIGALIGVIVIIAIIIFVVRRMGQYSPAKKRKAQKQQSISPLKRKARQEDKKKKSGKF